MSILFIGGPEFIIVIIAVLMLFGANKIPELARGLGKGMKEFKKATEDIKKEINDSTNGMADDVKSIKKDIKKGL